MNWMTLINMIGAAFWIGVGAESAAIGLGVWCALSALVSWDDP